MPRTILLSTLLVAALTAHPAAGATDRPNVVVMLVDDMGWADIGCYGGEIPTPNLDALAAGGVRFTQFHNTGRCSPTRAALLTGLYPHQAGMGHLDGFVRPGHPGFQGKLSDSSITIAEVLRDAGYFTCMTGKWHLGQQHGTPPWTRGFTRSLNLAAGGVHFSDQSGPKGSARLFLDGVEKPLNDPLFGSWYGADLWAEWGNRFIDEALEVKQPFFLYLAHCAPHFPLMAPEPDIERHRGRYRAGWDALREARHRRQIDMGLVDAAWPLTPRAESSPAWEDVPADKRERFDHMMAIYAAMIERIDRSVGTVVAHLRDRGVLENTLILFLSDNGGNAESGPDGRYEGDRPGDPHSNVFLGQNWATLNNTPFRKWKHHVHEGGTATPLIAHWPAGIPAARRGALEHQPGHVIDVMATVLDVAGAAYPPTRDGHAVEPPEGVSLGPAFAGGRLERTAPIFFNHEDNRAVRDGAWKLVAPKGRPWELYDMVADRSEMHDVAAEHPERVRTMAEQYRAWARRTHVEVAGIPGWGEKPEGQRKRQPQKRKQAAAATRNQTRPNILLIIADDLCWRDLGFTGNVDVVTPNLDRLRGEGMFLTQMYTPATTCSPSRHALYTGLFCVRAGAYPNHTRVHDGTRSVFTHLAAHGYRVALQNKEHVGPRASFPYEHIRGADDLTETRAFVTRKRDEPWMLVYASNDPHGPWTRGPRERFDPDRLTVPSYLHDNAVTRGQLADYYAEIGALDEQVGKLMRLLDETDTAAHTLVMFVSEQGSSFPYGGKWSLYDTGIRVATLVRWPGHVQPGSTSPALVQYVDVAPTFLAAAGIDPTTIDTGCPDAHGATGFDGRSFLDVLTGRSHHCRDVVFSQHTTVGINGYREPYPMRAARDIRYKYIRNLAPENTYFIAGIHEGEPISSWRADARSDPALAARVAWLSHRPAEELYDLEADPDERHNLASDPAYEPIKARLGRDLDAWMTQQGDKGLDTELEAPSRQARGRDKQPGEQAGRTKQKRPRKAMQRP